jgi:hypothetical protein
VRRGRPGPRADGPIAPSSCVARPARRAGRPLANDLFRREGPSGAAVARAPGPHGRWGGVPGDPPREPPLSCPRLLFIGTPVGSAPKDRYPPISANERFRIGYSRQSR